MVAAAGEAARAVSDAGARMPRRLLAALVAVLAVVAASTPAQAQATTKSQQVRIAYVPPDSREHEAIHDALRGRRSLEQVADLLSPLRLPRPLLLKVESCAGEANAWYAVDEITICYEYLSFVLRIAPTEVTPTGVTRADFLSAMFLDVVLHEAAHAVFDMLQIPVLGREEDAADQFAAFVLLQLPREDAGRLIAGIAHGYAAELKLRDIEDLRSRKDDAPLLQSAAAHSSPAQRLFNVLCIAYGADPHYFAGIVDRGVLPETRAAGCLFEFFQVAYAWRVLIQPHVDADLAQRVLSRRWVPEAGAKPIRR
jgi:hypothetical protein